MCYFYFHFLMIKDGYGTVVLKVDGWDGWLYLWDSVSVPGGGEGIKDYQIQIYLRKLYNGLWI